MRRLAAAGLFFFSACAAMPEEPSEPSADSFSYFYLDVHKPFFARSPDGKRFETRRPLGRKSQSFAAQKPPGLFRVFIVGGSVAQLYGIGDATPTLREALSASLGGREVEVLNCGMSAYDAARARLVYDEVSAYSPDLVLWMTGANEWGRPLFASWQSRLCGLNFMRSFCRRAVSAVLAARVPSAERFRGVYAGVLRSVARKAKHAGTPLLWATLPVSLRDMPPRGVLPLESEMFFKAWIRFEEGRWKQAAEGFRSYLSASENEGWEEGEGFAHFYLAKSLDKLGRHPEALAEYRRAQNDYRPLPMMNEAMRKIALEEGIPLADLEKAFEAAAADGIPGRDLFEDDVHWDRSLDPLATAAVVETLLEESRGRPRGPIARAGTWSRGWLTGAKDGILRSARALKMTRERSWYVFQVRMWEPLRMQENLFSERVLSLLETVRLANPEVLEGAGGMRSWLKKKLTGNIWMEDDEAKLDRWWPAMLAHVGELYRRKGMQERARLFFDEALRLDPGLKRARLHKALSYAASGSREEAKREIERLDGWREDVLARRWMERYGL